MSCPNMVWALYRPGVTETERTILIHMANAATKGLVCWDTMAKIAGLFGMSIRTVHRAIHGLAEKKLIRIQTRFRQPNHYHLLMPDKDEDKRPPQPVDGDKSVSTQPLNGDKSGVDSGVGVTNLATKGDKSGKSSMPKMAGVPPKKESPNLSENFSNSLLEESKPEPKPTVADMPAPKASKRPSLDGIVLAPEERAMVSLWWRHAEAGDLPKPGLTSRLSYIHQRFPYAGFPWLLENVPEAAAIAAAQGWHHVPMGASP